MLQHKTLRNWDKEGKLKPAYVKSNGKTKNTDGFYLLKRNISCEYNPLGPYDFEKWIDKFNLDVKSNYLKLPNELLFDKTIKLSFEESIEVLKKINDIFKKIDE